MKDLVSLVNILQGTASDHDFSTGNTLPLIARPWGMHHWTLQTGKAPWSFDSRRKKLWGIRLTHQPSPWMRDYASLMIMPFHGSFYDDPMRQASAYRQDKSTLMPSFLRTDLIRYGIEIKMAPTERGAVFVFSSRSTEPLKLRFQFDGPFSWRGTPWDNVLEGKTSDCFEGEHLENFGLHWRAEFDVAPEVVHRTDHGGWIQFPAETRQVSMKFAGSFISQELAQRHLEREVGERALEQVAEEGRRIWNNLMGRIRIEAHSEEQLATFYSCLYRCLLFPRFLDECDADGNVVHYSPFNGEVMEGSLCTDSGFWDTYRTLFPLLVLVYPDVVLKMANGWLNACRESRWAPKWSSPGSRDCMIGTHFDVFVADLVCKGIVDWDVEEVFQFLWKDATEPSTNGRYGRRGLREYSKSGFVPAGKGPYPVSSTLDYAYDDFCVAVVAKYLGKEKETVRLFHRAGNYRNLYDAQTGFMRARHEDGEWEANFKEFAWGGAYIEGGPWQHLFHVPHDVDGLIELMGGKEAFCRRLDQMLASPPRFEAGTYPLEIHEMTEMAVADFGQYAQSNQPVHAFLFLYALAGQPEKTEHWVGRVLKELYSRDVFPGDEDNGEMSAWYVWSSLGLYPVCPGKPEYLVFAPAVKSAELRIPGMEKPLVLGGSALEEYRGRLIPHGELISRT